MKRFSEISKSRSLDESTTIYSELMLMNSKIAQIAGGVESLDKLDPEHKEKLSVAADCLRDVYNGVVKIDNKIRDRSGFVVEAVIKSMGNGTDEPLLLEDGTTIEIHPELAYAISFTHDQLNEDNQKKLRELLYTSKDSFDVAVKFCMECVE